MVTDLLALLITIIDSIWSRLLPFDLLQRASSFMALAITYIPRFKTFISYVMYFIPSYILLPIIYVVSALIVARIVMAIARVITDIF